MGYPLDFMDDDCDIDGFPLKGIGEDEGGTNKLTHEALRQAAMPLVWLLTKFCSPHTSVLVTMDRVEVVESVIGVPVDGESY